MRLNPRLQGDLGERSAMLWFWARGAVFVPLGHSPDYDLIADWGEGGDARAGEDVQRLPQEPLGGNAVHPRRKSELEWSGQASRSVAIRLSIRSRRRWSKMAHS